jgi:hypothetical protein
MKNQSQAGQKPAANKSVSQPKTLPLEGREGNGRNVALTWIISSADGREFARLDFEPALAAIFEAALARLHLSPSEFLRRAVAAKIAAERRAA